MNCVKILLYANAKRRNGIRLSDKQLLRFKVIDRIVCRISRVRELLNQYFHCILQS